MQLMVASAGGMGDVIRDVPRQIAAQGDDGSCENPIIFLIAFDSNIYYTLHFNYRG